MDKTHFIINFDIGRTLEFRDDDIYKYAAVVSGGEKWKWSSTPKVVQVYELAPYCLAFKKRRAATNPGVAGYCLELRTELGQKAGVTRR